MITKYKSRIERITYSGNVLDQWLAEVSAAGWQVVHVTITHKGILHTTREVWLQKPVKEVLHLEDAHEVAIDVTPKAREPDYKRKTL